MTRGTITLVFDDGYEEIHDKIVPLLNQHHIPAVFATPLQHQPVAVSENEPTLPYTTWQTIVSAGHELAAHSITHRNLTTLSPAELEQELAEPAASLPATTLVYPGGAHNDQVRAKAAKYYRAARTVRHGFETIPPADPWQLKTINYTQRNFSASKANLRATHACLTNRWLIETFHLVTDHPSTNMHTVSISEFTKHLRFLARLPIAKKTIQDII